MEMSEMHPMTKQYFNFGEDGCGGWGGGNCGGNNLFTILLLFFLFQFIISLILKLLNVLAKLPVLKQANKTLGIVAGVVQGALWALLIATILQAVAATGLIPMVSEELLDSTILVKWLSSINPLHTYMQEIFTVTA